MAFRVAPPEGFALTGGFLAAAEQAALLEALLRVELRQVALRGQIARRLTAHFGIDYQYEQRALTPGPPLPAFLLSLRSRAAAFAQLEPDALVEALVSFYPPGAGIGWHRDAPQFGQPIVGVSVGGEARLVLRPDEDSPDRAEVLLEPGSAYLLSGPARWRWQHRIPPQKKERWSVTFRPLRK